MKKLSSIIFTFVLLTGFCACGSRHQYPQRKQGEEPANYPKSPDDNLESSTKSGSASYLINGESPKDYYSNFLFRKISTCPGAWFEYAGSSRFAVGRDRFDRDILGDIKIMFFDNGVYLAYEQESVAKKRRGKSVSIPGSEEGIKISGRWAIEGVSIELEGLGVGTPMMRNGLRTIELTFERDLIHQGLKGRTILVGKKSSSELPDDHLFKCPAD